MNDTKIRQTDQQLVLIISYELLIISKIVYNRKKQEVLTVYSSSLFNTIFNNIKVTQNLTYYINKQKNI